MPFSNRILQKVHHGMLEYLSMVNNKRLYSNLLKHTLLLGIIIFIVSFYSVNFKNYLSIPWWFIVNSDADNVYPVSALLLINGERIEFIGHPGTPLTQLHGIAFRLCANILPSFDVLTRMSEISNSEMLLSALSKVSIISRYLVIMILALLAIVLYTVCLAITNSTLLTFLLVLHLMTSNALLWYTTAIRPEPINFIFFLIALLTTLKTCQKKSLNFTQYHLYFVLIGLFLGYSILAKIQIIPVVVIYVALLCFYLLRSNNQNMNLNPHACSHSALLVSVINLIVMPWWAFKRPTFVTSEYVNQFPLFTSYQKLYGTLPENYMMYPILGLSLLLLLSGINGYGLKNISFWPNNINRTIAGLNLIVSGSIIAIYTSFLFISNNFTQYALNIQNTVYSSMANILNGSYLSQNSIDLTSLAKLAYALDKNSIYLINISDLLAIIGIFSVYRIFTGERTIQKTYCAILISIGTCMVTGLLATLRSPTFYGYYSIYPLTFAMLAIALCFSTEIKRLIGANLHNYARLIYGILIFCLCMHCTEKYMIASISEQSLEWMMTATSVESELKFIADWMPSFTKYLP